MLRIIDKCCLMATPVLVLGQGRVDELCMLAALQCVACHVCLCHYMLFRKTQLHQAYTILCIRRLPHI